MSTHGISLQLETTARKVMNFKNRPIGTMYDADSIESESFIEVMVLLLKVKNNFAVKEEIENFADKYSFYIGKSVNTIGLEKATAICKEFEVLLSSL